MARVSRLTALVMLCLAGLVPATVHARSLPGGPAPVAAGVGCHAWAPIFRSVLVTLGAGKIEVALPSYVPGYGLPVYAHARVLQPPLTYQVWLTTSPSATIRPRDVLLEISGDADDGKDMSRLGASRKFPVDGKVLYVHPGSNGMTSATWFGAQTGITYTVSVPHRFSLKTLLAVAGSLTPGPLRKTPLSAHPIKVPPPCA